MNTDLSLFGFATSDAAIKTDAPLVFMNRTVSFSVFADNVYSLARWLIKNGVKKGEQVAICMPNIPQTVIALYAVNLAGGIANMVHPLINPLGLRHIIEESDIKFLFIEESFLNAFNVELGCLEITKIVADLSAYLSKPERAIYRRLLKRKGKLPVNYGQNTIKMSEARSLSDESDYPLIYPEDIALIMHSGGTTGEPKSIMLSNKAVNELAARVYAAENERLQAGDGVYTVLPLFHGFGLGVCVHMSICVGARVVLIPRFNAKEAIKIIRSKNIRMLVGVPQMFQKLLAEKNFRGKALGGLTNIYSGGEKMDAELMSKFNLLVQKYGCKTKILEGYGLTEVVTVCTVNSPEHCKEGSVGKPLSGIEICIRDENNAPLSVGKIGEITIYGPTMMNGYYKDEKATEQTFCTDENGKKWLKTGDIGYVDEDGFLYFSARIKRLIRISSYNVFPAEIEKYALEVEGVKQCVAVQGSQDEKTIAVLFIVPYDGVDTEALKISAKKILQRNLPKWSVPRKVEILDKFPLTSVGKIDVDALSKLAVY